MRYKKLHNKSIPKKYLHKKSKSKVVGTKRIIIYIPDRLDDQISIDSITPVKDSITEEIIIDVEINSDTLTIIPLENKFGGPVIATITAIDNGGEFVNDNFEILIEQASDG